MRKVKYVPSRVVKYSKLTIGKIYEVMGSNKAFITIMNDKGMLDNFYGPDFEDVTTEYRNVVIDEILS